MEITCEEYIPKDYALSFLASEPDVSKRLKRLRERYPEMVVSRGRFIDVWENYEIYLARSGWRFFRDKTIRVRGCRCENCKSESDLQVHHKTYINIGNEKPEDVIVVCEPCHTSLHNKMLSMGA